MSTKHLTLVRDGEAVAEIVLASDAPERLRWLARELAEDLEAVTGAAFGIVTPAEVTKAVRIRIGAERSTALPFDQLRHDGFFIWTVGADVYLAGRDEHGTTNAVAAFIADELGVRRYMPGPLFRHVPNQRIDRIPARRIVSNPSFPTRAYGLANPLAKEWCVLNRLFNKADARPFIASSRHNIGFIFADERFRREHPEYFALREGKRDVPVPADGPYAYLQLAFDAQLCFSNPGVIEETVAAARRFFDEHPEEHTFSLGVNDTEKYCECEACAAINAVNADAGGKLVSNRRRYMMAQGHPAGRNSNVYFHFVNEVARRLKQTHPDKYVGCLAYESVEEPPTNIDRLEDNVCICLTQDSSQYFDEEYRARDRAITAAWLEKAACVMKYDYYGLMWFYPRTFAATIEEDIRHSARIGLVGMYTEVHPIWAFTGPMLYLGARMLWDASADAGKVRSEFLRDLYGAAATDISAFYDEYARLWQKPRNGQWFQGLLFPPQPDQYTIEEVERAHHALESALESSDSDLVRDRVEYLIRYHEVPLQIARAHARAIEARQAGDLDSWLAPASEALAALRGLNEAHARILEDPTAELSIWKGFRFEAVRNYMTHFTRDGGAQGLGGWTAALTAADLDRAADQLRDPAAEAELRLRAHTERGGEMTRVHLRFGHGVDRTWRVESEAPGKTVVDADGEPGTVTIAGAGELLLRADVPAPTGRLWRASLPVSTKGVSILDEFEFSLAWLEEAGEELGKVSRFFPDTAGSFRLVLAGMVPERATTGCLTVRISNFSPGESFRLEPVEFEYGNSA